MYMEKQCTYSVWTPWQFLQIHNLYKKYQNEFYSVTFAYVCAFCREIANIPVHNKNVSDENKQYLLCVSVAVVITNCSWFIVLAESV
jgi:hypothetical protein